VRRGKFLHSLPENTEINSTAGVFDAKDIDQVIHILEEVRLRAAA